MLNLDRPIVFLDLEATGTDPETARIIQIAMTRFVPGGAPESFVSNVNPEAPIPASVADLTGITGEDVADAPTFRDIIDQVTPMIEDADLAGYNAISYDVKLLKAEYERAWDVYVVGEPDGLPGPDDRVTVDPYRLEKALVSRTLAAMYERYTNDPMEDAHDAKADVEATIEVLISQIETHIGENVSARQLAEIARGDYLDDDQKLRRRNDGSVEMCFGKHRGKTISWLADHDPNYFDWMYNTITDLQPHIDEALS